MTPKTSTNYIHMRLCLVHPISTYLYISTGRVTAADSLFTYPTGSSFADYNDLNFVPTFSDMNAAISPEAQALCGDVTSCLFDFMVTGDSSFAQETLNIVNEQQEMQNALDGLLMKTFFFQKIQMYLISRCTRC